MKDPFYEKSRKFPLDLFPFDMVKWYRNRIAAHGPQLKTMTERAPAMFFREPAVGVSRENGSEGL